MNTIILKNPNKAELGSSAIDLLMHVNKPFWIFIEGEDSSRSRVITTLLHANEPSGINAIYQWLILQKKPAVNIYFFIGAVQSALQKPYFSRRYLENGQDLNRCFNLNSTTLGGAIANEVKKFLKDLQPEAVLDLHNTTSPGASFAIAISNTRRHHRLASFFTSKFVVNHFDLGAIMDQDSASIPIVTIECGGYNDPQSIKTAFMGIEGFTECDELWSDLDKPVDINIYNKPYRLEYINKGCISFGDAPSDSSDLTILNNFSNKNFESLKQGQLFAYTKQKELDAVNSFNAFIDESKVNCAENYFFYKEGCIFIKKDIKIFMLTTNPSISKSDCICYFVD